MKREGSSPGVTRLPDSAAKRSNQLLSGLSLNPESVQRRERRARELEREEQGDHRESEGKKRHFVHVNPEGKPYGSGINVWNDALAKVVRGLDPIHRHSSPASQINANPISKTDR